MSDNVRINGNAHSWGSIGLKIMNDAFFGFNSISYADKRERTKVYGMGRHHAPRGRTRGKYSTDPVKVSGPKGSAEALRDLLAVAAADGRSIGDVEFDIDVFFTESSAAGFEKPMHVRLEGCVLVGDASSHEENPDPLKDELEFDCMRIRRNGRVLFDASRGAP